MKLLISPTNKGIRGVDDFGSGNYLARRGKEIHGAVDFICTPGQDILSPIEGSIIRVANPYAGDPNYSGLLIENSFLSLKLFYLNPNRNLIGKKIKQGEKIGIAQDISKKYNVGNKKMTPHIHLEINKIDPMVLL
jgi:hypothetical protein